MRPGKTSPCKPNPHENIRVLAYSGFRGEESPRAFFLGDQQIIVAGLLNMWTEEDLCDRTRKRFFLVKGNDERIYKIYHDEKTLEWFSATK